MKFNCGICGKELGDTFKIKLGYGLIHPECGVDFVVPGLIKASPINLVNYEAKKKEAYDNAVKALGEAFDCEQRSNDFDFTITRKIIERFKEADKEPRTKEEYENVDFIDAWESVKAYCDGEELYCGALNKVKCPEMALKLWVHGSLYRKVTKPIEWWEDAVEYTNETMKDKCASRVSDDGEVLHVRASMTRDQWCDFARILLEQGE